MENNIIKQKLLNIKKDLKYLNEAYNKKKTEKNKFELILIETSIAKFIEEIVENAIKINSYLLKEKDEYSTNYFQSFVKLSEIYSLDYNFFKELAKTTSFRNNLVHNYDDNITKKKLNENIEPLINLYLKYVKIIETNFLK